MFLQGNLNGNLIDIEIHIEEVYVRLSLAVALVKS
jgi:hypothetical protein